MNDTEEFSGCMRACRTAGKHTLRAGCEHAPVPPPTVSIMSPATGADGHPVTAFDVYTAEELADVILHKVPDRTVALAAAEAILTRHRPNITVGGRLPRCVHCNIEIENRGDPDMGGNHHIKWVHVPGGYQFCFPQLGPEAKASPGQHCPACGTPVERHPEDQFVYRSDEGTSAYCSPKCATLGSGQLRTR